MGTMLLKNIILYILSCMVESTCMLPLENGGIIVLAYVEGTLPSGIYPPQMMKH
jgi:hypothetical protein